MAQLIGVSCGLLVFSAMILFGMLAHNPVETILLRALAGMFAALFLGHLAGWIGAQIVREDAAAAVDKHGKETEVDKAAAPSDSGPDAAPTQV